MGYMYVRASGQCWRSLVSCVGGCALALGLVQVAGVVELWRGLWGVVQL